MAWHDHWWEVALDVLSGGIYSAAKGGTEAVVQATQPAGGLAGGGYISLPVPSAPGRGLRPPTPPDLRHLLPSPEPRTPDGGCCQRFQLSAGFLLDTATGRVWQYSQTVQAFLSVPLQYGGDDRDLADLILKKRLQQLEQKYSDEVLSTLPAKSRAAQMAAFDKEYLEPIRRAALGKARSARPK
jgi:hypothetical protein